MKKPAAEEDHPEEDPEAQDEEVSAEKAATEAKRKANKPHGTSLGIQEKAEKAAEDKWTAEVELRIALVNQEEKDSEMARQLQHELNVCSTCTDHQSAKKAKHAEEEDSEKEGYGDWKEEWSWHDEFW